MVRKDLPSGIGQTYWGLLEIKQYNSIWTFSQHCKHYFDSHQWSRVWNLMLYLKQHTTGFIRSNETTKVPQKERVQFL